MMRSGLFTCAAFLDQDDGAGAGGVPLLAVAGRWVPGPADLAERVHGVAAMTVSMAVVPRYCVPDHSISPYPRIESMVT